MTESQGLQLSRFGLYYPYIHFRDERWLKIAALYWPRLARIVPGEYPVRDSDTVRRLVEELDFTLDLDPRPATSSVVAAFEAALDGLVAWQRDKYPVEQHLADFFEDRGPRPIGPDSAAQAPPSLAEHIPLRFGATHAWRVAEDYPGERFGAIEGEPEPSARELAGVHTSEVDPTLGDALVDAGLAVRTRGEQWFVMHRDLAWAYKCLLSSEIAARNALSLTTDQVQAHAAAGLAAVDVVDHGLSGYPSPRPDAGHAGTEYEVAFGLMSLNLVVPDDLDAIPIEKIITVRKRFGDEFDRWRRHVDLAGAQLSKELQGIESPDVLDAYLRDAVRQLADRPRDALRRGLRDVGINASETAITTKYELPAGLAAIGVAAAEPHLAVAAGVGIGLFSLVRRARGARRAERVTSPVAYLLEVQKGLSAKSALERVGRMLRIVSGVEKNR